LKPAEQSIGVAFTDRVEICITAKAPIGMKQIIIIGKPTSEFSQPCEGRAHGQRSGIFLPDNSGDIL